MGSSQGDDIRSAGGIVDDAGSMTGQPTTSGTNELAASLAGSIINYTATLEMTGDCGCAATTFTAPTPANTTVVPGSVVVTGGTGTVVQTVDPLKIAVGAMGVGDSITVSWQVTVDQGFTGDISEQASLGCTQLTSNLPSDDPSTTPFPDPTVVTVSQSVIAVPTLDGIGLALLFGLLLLAGLLLFRRKKTGVALLLMAGLMAALALPARAAPETFGVRSSRSSTTARQPRAKVKSEQDREVLHAVTLSQVATVEQQIRLTLSDGTALTVTKGKVRVLPKKLTLSARQAMSHQERRRWRKQ